MSCGHFHASYLWRDAATCEFSLQIISKCLDSRFKKEICNIVLGGKPLTLIQQEKVSVEIRGTYWSCS